MCIIDVYNFTRQPKYLHPLTNFTSGDQTKYRKKVLEIVKSVNNLRGDFKKKISDQELVIKEEKYFDEFLN